MDGEEDPAVAIDCYIADRLRVLEYQFELRLFEDRGCRQIRVWHPSTVSDPQNHGRDQCERNKKQQNILHYCGCWSL